MTKGRSTPLAAWAFVVAALALPATAVAQGVITGRVTDEATNTPLVGVQISIEGSTVGSLTGADGRYRLEGVSPGTYMLRAVYIGFGPLTRRVSVASGETVTVDFALSVTAISLDEVVVTATGEQRKREIGNAVATIDATAVVENAQINSVADLLQARTAGVTVSNSAGSPGMGSRIRIRGSNSISLSNQPLIYVDGIRVESGAGTTVGTGGQEPSRIDDFNPEDIESIEIVKGPAAATLYGTEAANGVIRITTKQGRAGRTAWNVWLETGIVNEPNEYPLNYAGLDANSSRYGEFCLLDFEARGLCNQTGISRYQILDDPVYSPIDDGMRRQFGASVTGGGQGVNYYISAEFENEEAPYQLPGPDRELLQERGIRINDQVERPQQLDRINLRANLNAQIADNATLALRAGFLTSDLSLTGNDNNSFGFLPSAYFGGAFPDRPDDGWGFQRPAELFGRDMFQNVERFTGSATGTWQPLSFLSGRATLGLDYTSRKDISFFPRDLGVPGQSNLGRKDTDFFDIFQYTVDAVGSAAFNLTDRISSKTSVGTQYFRNLFTGTQAWGIDIVNGAASIGAAAENHSSESTTETKTFGVFAEQQFGLNDRLFLTAAVRADDNSAFGKDFDLVYYPKFSLSWIATEEPFFPQAGFLDQFRLRLAWGRSGLQPGTTAAIRTLDADAITDPDDNTVSGVSIGEIGNALLEPEQSSEIEVGFDADLFGGRVGLELTHYNKKSEDALITVPLAPSLGASNSRWVNIGEVQNRGWEAFVSAALVDTDAIAWNIGVGGSINHNELLTLGEGTEPIGSQTRHVPGFPLGGQWEQPILSYNDDDGNGILTADELVIGDTLEYIGPGLPQQEATVSSTVTLFDRVRVYGLLNYRGDYIAYNNTERFRCRFRLCGALIDRETPMWDQARAVASLYHSTQTVWGYMEDASNWKLREVSVSFFVPDQWAQRIRASRATITLTGRNLATWTDYTGMDPEINWNGANDNFGTSEFLTQPPLRYWVLRVNLNY